MKTKIKKKEKSWSRPLNLGLEVQTRRLLSQVTRVCVPHSHKGQSEVGRTLNEAQDFAQKKHVHFFGDQGV